MRILIIPLLAIHRAVTQYLSALSAERCYALLPNSLRRQHVHGGICITVPTLQLKGLARSGRRRKRDDSGKPARVAGPSRAAEQSQPHLLRVLALLKASAATSRFDVRRGLL